MPIMISLARKVLISVIAVGTTSLATVGMAGQAGATTTSPGSHAAVQSVKHLNCANAQQKLGHVKRLEARFSKRLAKLKKAEAKAEASGHKARVARLARAITREQARRNRILGKKLLAKEAKVAKAFSAKCHVALSSTPTANTKV
jgi:hypothetical protein